MLNILESQGMQIVLRKWCFVIRTVFTFNLHLRSALCIYRTPERPNSQNKCTLDLPVWNHMKSQLAQTLWVKSRQWINLFEKLKIREREVVKHFEQWDPYITSFPNSLWNHWIMWHCEIIVIRNIDMKPIWKLSEWKLWKNHKHRKLKKDGAATVEQRDLHGRIPGTASVNFLLQSGWKARPPCRYIQVQPGTFRCSRCTC